jgi:hypothetical protein
MLPAQQSWVSADGVQTLHLESYPVVSAHSQSAHRLCCKHTLTKEMGATVPSMSSTTASGWCLRLLLVLGRLAAGPSSAACPLARWCSACPFCKHHTQQHRTVRRLT